MISDEPIEVLLEVGARNGPLKLLETPAAWRGDRLSAQDWVFELGEAQILELETLGARFIDEDPDLRFVQASDFPLPATSEAISRWKYDLVEGRGFMLVRGLRSHLYSDALCSAIFMILGLHLGEPLRQNEVGDVLDHIYATSEKTIDDPTALSSKIRDELSFHRDGSDTVGLMCLRPAKVGGTSCLVSSVEVYNEILRRRPDLAPLLFDAYPRDWRRQDHDSPAMTYPAGVVNIIGEAFEMDAGTPYIFTAQEYPGVPKLTDDQINVLNLLEDITREPGMALEMDFRPGDIQWVANATIMHARTRFQDYPEPQRRRHLLRLWLSSKGDRPSVELGGVRMQRRDEPRDTQSPDDLGNFHIGVAAVPRLIA